MAPLNDWIPMSYVPPSPAIASTVRPFLPRAFIPATSPEAEAPVVANGVLTQGTVTDVTGYMPCNTVRQLAGTVTMTCPSNAFRI